MMQESTKGSLMMGVATLLWGASYLFMQDGIQDLRPGDLIFRRFAIGFAAAALLLGPGPWKRIEGRILLHGAILGGLLAGCFYVLLIGLRNTTTGNAGFLLGTTVVWVALIQSILKRQMPSLLLSFCVLLALSGAACLTLRETLTFGTSDLLCLVTAWGYAVHITVNGVLVRRSRPLDLGFWQIGFAGVFGLLLSLLLEGGVQISAPGHWGAILFLGICCSAFGFLLQSMAQARLRTERVGILYSMEPLFAWLLGILVLHEPCSIRGAAGCLCILLSILLPGLCRGDQRLPSRR